MFRIQNLLNDKSQDNKTAIMLTLAAYTPELSEFEMTMMLF